MRRLQQSFAEPEDQDMMGPLLRRKKVLSVPLGATGEEFFFGPPSGQPQRRASSAQREARRQSSYPGQGQTSPTGRLRRSSTIFGNLVRRKQVSLDLYAPEQAEFFGGEGLAEPTVPGEEVGPIASGVIEAPIEEEGEEEEEGVKLFKPLRFSPRVRLPGGKGFEIEEGPSMFLEAREVFDRQYQHNQELMRQIEMLTDRLENEVDQEEEKLLEDIQATKGRLLGATKDLKEKLYQGDEVDFLEEEVDLIEAATGEDERDLDDSKIIRAKKGDYIWTGILLCVMITFTGVVVGWDTHLDETYSTFGPVGLACATPCEGDLDTQDYFNGHSQFETGQFIQLVMQLDPHVGEAQPIVELVGVETNETKEVVIFGPPTADGPLSFQEKIEVDFPHPHEDHIINVYSTDSTVKLTYKLHASTLSPMAKHSELIAALIMVFVYLLILLEIIHRTLVAIFGSLVASLFYFLIHEVSTHRHRSHLFETLPLSPVH